MNELPDELVGHILVKSRVGVHELMSAAMTCTRFHGLSKPVLSICGEFAAKDLQFDVADARALFSRLPASPENERLLVGIVLNKVVSQRAKIPASIMPRAVLDSLHGEFRGGGPRKPSLCVSTAPKASMQLALACLPAKSAVANPEASTASDVVATLLHQLAKALGSTQDEQTCLHLITLIQSLHSALPVGGTAVMAAYQFLPKLQDAQLQLATIAVLLGFCSRGFGVNHITSRNAAIGAILMGEVGKRIADGSLFQHPAKDEIISACLADNLRFLTDLEQGKWLTLATGCNLCPAIQQYTQARLWDRSPWPLLLLAKIYACTDPELEREALSARIGAALQIGGWQLITELEFADLDHRLRSAADPDSALKAWIQAKGRQDDAGNCTVS